ncbi:MAG TPA: glucoamylase family protein [Aquabacterium sp.]|nr:glucoamylase family protein [Aquabacterium sp.]
MPRLENNMAVLQQARTLLEARAREGQPLGPAAHWLLDNAALIDEQLHAVRQQLPRRFFKELPVLRDPPLAGLPRIYGVAWAWVAHTDSGFDEPLLEAYLAAYQSVRELRLAELWALPTTLRTVLVENLRRLAERTAATQAVREAAHRWIDQPDGARDFASLERLDAEVSVRGLAPALALQLLQREDDLPIGDATQLRQWLAQRLPDPAETLSQQQVQATADHQSIRNAITSLRLLDQADWQALFQKTSPTLRILQQSPVHAAEREDTQGSTLRAVARLARETGGAESAVAQVLVDQAAGGGDAEQAGTALAWWWQGPGRDALRSALGLRRRRWPWRGARAHPTAVGAYAGGLAVLSLLLVGWLLNRYAPPGTPWPLVLAAGLLLLGPVGEALVAVVNRLISESVRPARLPRLALEQGIPDAHRTLVVVPCLLTSPDAIDALCAQLQQHALANPERAVQFALLADFADAPAQVGAGDEALLTHASAGIALLNQRHGAAEVLEGPEGPAHTAARFLLLLRPRVWSDSEQCWLGWERKRGKLEQLVHALVDDSYHPFADLGRLSAPAPGVRYVVTLDSDTDLPPGRLRELVGLAAHPLNQPQLDPASRRVLSGYGILQPRVVPPLPPSHSVTPLRRLFGGRSGIDPYSAASSEVYQDLFGEGSFTGKGLLNVQAIHHTLSQRLPAEQVLSHDLLEGALARCAAVSDVTLIEDAPQHADVVASRLHRWTRGDWQLLPFLFQPARYPLLAIDRWKMADNLRRSLVAPLSLAALLLALATGVLPWGVVLTAVAAAFCAGPLLGAIAALAPSRDDISLQRFFRLGLTDVGRALLTAAWHIAHLPQSAMLATDAIARALHRQFVSRRHLLQWTTAAAAQAHASTELLTLLRRHVRAPLAAGLILALLGVLTWAGLPVAWRAGLGLCLLWAASPLATWWASRPQRAQQPQRLSVDDRQWLGALARDTWRYYVRHVGQVDNHLPPDNVQIQPQLMVAHRSSPTNIGLYLLSTACAHELGFIGATEMAERVANTLDTLERLPRHRGHFFNWYDTCTLAVLSPAYVSTVDSGNLSGHLLVLAQACDQVAAWPLPPAAARRALAASSRQVRTLAPVLVSTPTLLSLAQIGHGDAPWPSDVAQALALQDRVQQARTELDSLQLGQASGEDDRALWLMHDHLDTLASVLRDLCEDPAAMTARLQDVAVRCRTLALAADYAFLYDPKRHLLHIGYRAEQQQLDTGHYDLLASESRLTSLVAIAKGDVPVRHWAALGRPLFARGAGVGLKSWSGSMFEYLMPSLVLDEPEGSVLHQAAQSAVAEQRADGERHDTPWGLSESAYAGQDHTLAYQYGPQGVARLALRRTPADERVIAPYATLMALVVDPAAALANLQALQALGARGACGFFEALDFTPQRQSGGSRCVTVATYMAHHQGMGLLALLDLLADGAPRRWARGDPHLRAVTALLHEQAPREVPALRDPPPLPSPRRPRSARMELDTLPGVDALAPTHLLSNGRYSVALRSHGSGYSQWDGVGLSRWRDDLLRDGCGSFFFLRRAHREQVHSLTYHPAPDAAAEYRTRFQADRVIFDARWPELQSRCTVWVSPEDDIELRQVELENTGPVPLELSLSSCFEVTLSPQRADEAHPAFANLFIETRWDAAEQALYLRRKPRLPDEAAVQAVHFLAASDAAVEGVSVCTDRARWQGRYREAGQPLAPDGVQGNGALPLSSMPAGDGRPQPALGHADDAADASVTGLDPVAAITLRIRLPAHASARLTFGTAAARDRDVLEALVDKYRQVAHAERAASMSHAMAGIRLRELQFDADAWLAILRLNTLLTSQATREMPYPLRASSARCDRRNLWRFGVSGDRPILLVTISSEQGLPMVQTLKKALRLWTGAGVAIDLVVLNAEPASYLAPVQHQLLLLLERHLAQQDERVPAHRRATLHLLQPRELGADELFTLQVLARLRLQADSRSLAQQIERELEAHEQALSQRERVTNLPVNGVLPSGFSGGFAGAATPGGAPAAVQADRGSFEAGSGAFSFELSPRQYPSRPWINVLANADFGTQVSEIAGGFTWAGNSRMHQVSAWSNDPLADPSGEMLLLEDRDSPRVWALGRSLTPAQGRQITHGTGYTRMRQRCDGLDIDLCWCVDAEQSVKQVQVSITATGTRTRRLRLVGLIEWALGSARSDRLSIVTRSERWLPEAPDEDAQASPQRGDIAPRSEALMLQATQLDHLGGFGMATGFACWRASPDGVPAQLDNEDWTCDRREFHDARGRLVLPEQLGRSEGAGLDGCAALGCTMQLRPGQRSQVTLLLGHAPSPAAATLLARQVWRVAPAARLARQQAQWNQLLGAVTVQTPDPAFDALVNRWLPYQALACRIWARAGFYQASGAVGFRDQLQDAMALVHAAPQLLAQQIREHAARQFREGDVQHWWHMPGGAGVRTRSSDDLLWLPLAVAHYLRRTGDAALLDESILFLEGTAVPEGAEDIYDTPAVSQESATLYEHCARTIVHSLRTGAHGLPLMGIGDWNDGMNRVGHHGRGESVWLAWMLCSVVDEFLPIAQARGDAARVAQWSEARRGWVQALEAQAWDGRWYRRAYFDDGSPLGSQDNAECRIDLIAQAWAVLSGAGDPARARQAMDSARTLLLDDELQLARLLDPPLQHARPSAGYIQAYPPGVRENGGQYAHGAVWALMAFAKLGDARSAWRVFTGLSPAHRWTDQRLGPAYALEPYVMAGDIYSQPPYAGRGGWSWYTGSAGWMARAALESLCGVVLAQGRVSFAPCLPPHWPQLSVTLRHRDRHHRFTICAEPRTAHELLRRDPLARQVRAGESVLLDDLPDGSLHVLVAPLAPLSLRGQPQQPAAATGRVS